MAAWKGIVGKGFKPDQFDAYVRSLKFGAWHPQFIVLHNTGIPKLSQWHDYPGSVRMRGLQGYYRNQGWSGGPHLFVADDLIWAFTPLTVPGVHSPSWNAISWGVEMVGDYDVEPFNVGVRDNAVAALATLHAVMGLSTATLKLHREDPRTTHKHCPGQHVEKTDMVKRVHLEIIQRHKGEHSPNHVGRL